MRKDWPTSSYDLYIARQVINQHAKEDKPLGVFEIIISEKGDTRVHLAEWVTILRDFYHHTYGITQGDIIMRKVVTSCLLNGETVH